MICLQLHMPGVSPSENLPQDQLKGKAETLKNLIRTDNKTRYSLHDLNSCGEQPSTCRNGSLCRKDSQETTICYSGMLCYSRFEAFIIRNFGIKIFIEK